MAEIEKISLTKSIVNLHEDHLASFRQVEKENAAVYSALLNAYDVESFELNLQPDFCIGISGTSRAAYACAVSSSFLKFRRALELTYHEQYVAGFSYLGNWIYFNSLLFSTLVKKSDEGELKVSEIKNLTTVNSLLSECKKSFVDVLSQIKVLDDIIFENLKYIFSLGNSNFVMEPDFLDRLIYISHGISFDHLLKCSHLLSLNRVPFESDQNWEIISTTHDHIGGLGYLLSDCRKIDPADISQIYI